MDEPPTESGGGATGPPDRHVLRLLERRLADEPLVERTEFRPDAESDRWECQWDRHPNPHASRLHFHAPPHAADVEALELPSLHPLDVSSTVVAAIDDRVKTLWTGES